MIFQVFSDTISTKLMSMAIWWEKTGKEIKYFWAIIFFWNFVKISLIKDTLVASLVGKSKGTDDASGGFRFSSR